MILHLNLSGGSSDYSLIAPFYSQILTEYKDEDLGLVLEACERMHAHLTAAVVSNDVLFLQVIILTFD